LPMASVSTLRGRRRCARPDGGNQAMRRDQKGVLS
jgi:hypothetical protein